MTRLAAANYMLSHEDDFLPFLPSIEGEDGEGATSDGMMTSRQYNRYCATIRDTAAWGGEPEILALSRVFGVPIHVVQAGKPPVVIHEPIDGMSDTAGTKVCFISYHRRMYGLGEVRNLLPLRGSGLNSLPALQLSSATGSCPTSSIHECNALKTCKT
jgi:OTU domain-containing protein 6